MQDMKDMKDMKDMEDMLCACMQYLRTNVDVMNDVQRNARDFM
jgi:hypothetical protein